MKRQAALKLLLKAFPGSEVLSEVERSGDKARARRTDPITSHSAADSVDVKGHRAVVLEALRFGPATDEELIDRIRQRWPEAAPSDQSIRSRRCELRRMGFVRATDEFRPSSRGNSSRVWGVVE